LKGSDGFGALSSSGFFPIDFAQGQDDSRNRQRQQQPQIPDGMTTKKQATAKQKESSGCGTDNRKGKIEKRF
jgi:hypothetical protein